MKPTVRRWILGIALGVLLLIGGCTDNTFTTTLSGLRYKDEQVGEGPAAKKDDLVEVHYTGRLRDGKEFDSSRERDFPFFFVLGHKNVIAGWDEGLKGMKVGGKRKLVIPPNLAYGEKGAGSSIPPNAELTFDVELLGIYQHQLGGLYVRELEIGKGEAVKDKDHVEIQFTGWVTGNGKQFVKNSEDFVVGTDKKVTKGLSQGVVGMKIGGKRKLVVPYTLGYGPEGFPNRVPAKAELLYEVELIKIK